MAPLPVPWERQSGEASSAFAAFCVYRDLGGERNFRKVSESFGKTQQWWSQVAGRWGWQTRAFAWDNEQDRQRRAVFMRERLAMDERQARAGQLMQARGAKRIADMTETDVKMLT